MLTANFKTLNLARMPPCEIGGLNKGHQSCLLVLLPTETISLAQVCLNIKW